VTKGVEEIQLISALAELDAAVAAGEVTGDNLARWKAEGEALTLDELAGFTLAALQGSQYQPRLQETGNSNA
jgi:hypothetical protein